MTEDQLQLFYNYVTHILASFRTKNDDPSRWHISFGTLLYFIRDRRRGDKYEQDFDVNMFYGDVVEKEMTFRFESYQFERVAMIVDDVDHKPLHLSYRPIKEVRPRIGDMTVDIFFWYKHGNHLYHTFGPADKKGVPKEYVMRGIPEKFINGPSWGEYWFDNLLQCYLPRYYGCCLDYWYPGWEKKMTGFGTSKTRKKVVLKSFKDWGDESDIKRQCEASNAKYEEFVERLMARPK